MFFEALYKLRGPNSDQLVQNEYDELEEEKQKVDSLKKVGWNEIFTVKHLFRPLIVTIVCQMSQQLSGINAV